jgi:hypothetical protein
MPWFFVTCMLHQKLTSMKKLSAIGILLFFFAFTSFAQRTYSKQNLEQVSHEDLNFLFKKAQNIKKAGVIITVTASAIIITGLILQSAEGSHYLGEIYPSQVFIATGMLSLYVGVPLLVIGSSRVKKIKKVQKGKRTTFDSLMMELAPCSFHNYIAQNYQTGVTLRIKF